MADSAMATRTETLQGKLALDTSAWSKGLAQASTMFKGFSGGITRGLSQAFQNSMGAIKSTLGRIGGIIRSTLGSAMNMVGLGGLLSGGGLLAGLNNVANLGGTISDLSERTGIAASALMVLREQFRQGGVEVESVTQYIRRMFEALDDPKKANIFAQLGLDQASLARMNPDMAFNRILDGVRKLGSKMKQANVLSDLFGGRQGINLMTLVADKNSFNSAKEMVGSMAKDMDKFAPILDRISDILGPDGIGVKMQQIFFGILKEFSTDLLTLADKFAKLDFVAVGQNLAQWLEWGWNTFQNLVRNPGGIWQIFSNGFQAVALNAAAYLVGAMKVAPTALLEFIKEVLPDMGLLIFNVMKAAGGALAIGILEGIETIKEILPQSVRDALDKIMSASAVVNDYMPLRMLTPLMTGGMTNKEMYEHMRDNPDIVRQKFEETTIESLDKATMNLADTMKGGQKVLEEVYKKFEPNVEMTAKAAEKMKYVMEVLNEIPMPNQTPLQALTTPGATSTRMPSIWDNIGKGDSGGLRVSLDNNKIEMSGPHVVRMVTSLESIEDKLTIE